MIDVYIDDVEMENCRSHKEMSMDFPNNTFTVIQGKNGAGKSTVLKAVSMALFGVDGTSGPDKLSITEMVNTQVGRDMMIKVNFHTIDDQTEELINYRVELYYEHRKHKNNLYLFRGEDDISGKTKGDTYKIIEGLIYPADVYHNSVCFSQQVKNFFTSLGNADQKQIFDSILNTKIYNQYYKNVTKVLTDTTVKMVDKSTAIDKLADKELSLKENIEYAEIDRAQFIRDQSIKVSTAINALNDDKQKLTSVESELAQTQYNEQDYMDAHSNISALKSKIANHDSMSEKEIGDVKTKQQMLLNERIADIKSKAYDKEKAESASMETNKSAIRDEINAINDKLSHSTPLEDELNQLVLDHQQFTSTESKKITDLDLKISNINNEYSVNDLEQDLISKVQPLDAELVTLKERAAEIKSSAINTNNIIKDNQALIDEDQATLNSDHAICTKCKRPLVTENDIQEIQNGIRIKVVENEKLNKQLDEYKTTMASLKSRSDEIATLKLEYKSTFDQLCTSREMTKTTKLSELTLEKLGIESELTKVATEHNEYIDKLQKSIDEYKRSDRQSLATHTENLNVLDRQLNDIRMNIKSEFENAVNNIRLEFEKLTNKKISDIRDKYSVESNTYQESLISLSSTLTKLERDRNEVDRLNKLKIALEHSVSSFEKTVKDLGEERYDDTRLKSFENDLKKMEQIHKEEDEKLKSLRKDVKILEFWKEAFSDRGIKSMLIDAALPIMNKAVADTLDIIAPGTFTVSFDTLDETKSGNVRDKFTTRVLHNTKGTDKYKMLSGGEKRLVDLAIMDALRSLATELYRKRVHNIFYDEVLDSLDSDNRQTVCQAAKILSNDRSALLISHNTPEDAEPDRIFKI